MSQRHRLHQMTLGLRPAITLDFQIKTIREQPPPLLGHDACCRPGIVQQGLTDLAPLRARKRNQALCTQLRKPFVPDHRPTPMNIGPIRHRQQLTQAQITLMVLDQQQHTTQLVGLLAPGQPDIATDNRLHPLLPGTAIKLDQAKQIGEIRQRQRRHGILRRARHRIVNRQDTVLNREFAMETEMDEREIRHSRALSRDHGGTVDKKNRACPWLSERTTGASYRVRLGSSRAEAIHDERPYLSNLYFSPAEPGAPCWVNASARVGRNNQRALRRMFPTTYLFQAHWCNALRLLHPTSGPCFADGVSVGGANA
jgi:hypothetical protein